MKPLRFIVLLLVACTGKIDIGPGLPGVDPLNADPVNPVDPVPPRPVDACEGVTIAAGPASLRRLTVEQQTHSFHDLLTDTAALDLAPLAGPIITEQEVEKLNLAVHDLIGRKGHRTYLKCDIAGPLNDTCADQFIADFGRVAFRRSLTTEEKTLYKKDVYDAVRTNPAIVPAATFQECIDATAEAILQSPQLLYIHEQGVADATLPAGIRRLTGPERATRLSYLLWNSTPDAALLTAAESGALDVPAGVRTQADRLLTDPRARKAIRSVVSSWLELDGNSHQASLEGAPKDKTLFPFDSPALRSAMRQEVLALYERAFFDMGGSFNTLMTTRKAYVNKSLGTLYGVTTGLPANDTTWAWVDLNDAERAGLFTRAAFLALYAPQDAQSPIRRGVFLYRQGLGRQLGAPPPNVDNTPLKPIGTALSVRAQVEARTAPTGCQACHARINPLGFALENYDAMGRWQTVEKGTLDGTPYTAPVDSNTTLIDTDLKGDVKGPLALATRLGTSGMAHDAMVKVWFTRANERTPESTDACSLQRLNARFRQTDDMRDLLLALTSDDNALFIKEPQ